MNFVGIDPIKALIYSAIANGLIAPIILYFIVSISSNKSIMGEWVNKDFVAAVGWYVTIIMTIAGAAAIYSLFF
jgi:Mn2+/Fe2+ NRAMP family transporter